MLTKQIKMINDRLMFVSVWFITGFKVCFFNEPFPNVILFMIDKVLFLSVSKVVLYRQVFAGFLISVESLSKEVTRNQGPWWERRWCFVMMMIDEKGDDENDDYCDDNFSISTPRLVSVMSAAVLEISKSWQNRSSPKQRCYRKNLIQNSKLWEY